MKYLLLIVLLLIASPSILADGAAIAPQYAITELPPLQGDRVSQALALNDKGQVVGWSGADTNQAVIWENGQAHKLLSKFARYTVAHAINAQAQIVGSPDPAIMHNGSTLTGSSAFSISNGTTAFLPEVSNANAINDKGLIGGSASGQAAVFQAGKWRKLNNDLHYFKSSAYPVNTGGSAVYSLNEAGNAVGVIRQSLNNTYNGSRAFLWTSDKILLLDTPANQDSVAVYVNSHNDIVGAINSLDGKGWKPFLWAENGKAKTLPIPVGYSQAFVKGINDGRVAVGSASNLEYALISMPFENLYIPDIHAVMWQGDRVTDLNTFLPIGSDWVLQSAQAINQQGQIAGFGEHNGQMRGFLLTPVLQNH